jgi:uncharacterized phage-like protein YoqJ
MSEQLKNINCKTACFSGYRPEKMPLFNPDHKDYGRVLDGIKAAVRESYRFGCRTFLTGMAEGFDLMAGQCVIDLRTELTGIHLDAVIPFANHGSNFKPYWQNLYKLILSESANINTLENKYSKGVFLRRNDWMVDHSSLLICFYTGLSGGTRYTVNRASKHELIIINVAKNMGLIDSN